MSNDALRARSLAHVWNPCTQMQDHEREIPLVPIRSAQGVWLEDFEGKRYLDAISSWWTNLFGHCHPHIVNALKAQLDTLDHVLLAGFTHEPAIDLAEKLCAIAPPGLTRCFYADNGSSAVEVALKMSLHFWRNSGQARRTKFIALENGYHGETLGALAVGGDGIYRDPYAPLLFDVVRVPSPDCFNRPPGGSWEEFSRQQFHHMEDALQRHAGTIAAVIVEPLVQCAGGMRMYHPIYLKMLREACDRHGVHLIADEIAVGFGRSGRMFACEWAGIAPDLMCVSKGLTGGTLPLAATLATEAIYQGFYAEHATGKAFLHSHSYTGNPLACRAALASLELFELKPAPPDVRGPRFTSPVLDRTRVVSQLMWAHTEELRRLPHVAEVRQQGMILAIEMAQDVSNRVAYPAAERRGLRVYRHGLERGVLLRPLGNVIYLMPPYVISADEIELAVNVATEGIRQATS
jgi:adenosylmethionine-8-amino-7-oxononanoate aminotransferase